MIVLTVETKEEFMPKKFSNYLQQTVHYNSKLVQNILFDFQTLPKLILFFLRKHRLFKFWEPDPSRNKFSIFWSFPVDDDRSFAKEEEREVSQKCEWTVSKGFWQSTTRWQVEENGAQSDFSPRSRS